MFFGGADDGRNALLQLLPRVRRADLEPDASGALGHNRVRKPHRVNAAIQ